VLLTILGCSGSAPGPRSPSSGYLLEADGFLLCVELGAGTLAELQAVRDPFAVDALLFSHLHPDHCSDFSSLTVLRRYHPAPSRDPHAHRLPVFAPKEAPSRFANAYAPDEAERLATDLSDVYDFHTWNTDTVHIGPFTVDSVQAKHPCESYSFRITHGGASLVYTGDTGPSDELHTLAAGADVILAEASWAHGGNWPADLHLSGREAGEVAQRAGARRLLITHVPPWTDAQAMLDEARGVVGGESVLVRQGAEYSI